MIKEIKFTDNALKQINILLASKDEGSFFRIAIKGGGCSGLMYDLKFDNTALQILLLPAPGMALMSTLLKSWATCLAYVMVLSYMPEFETKLSPTINIFSFTANFLLLMDHVQLQQD